MSPLITVIINKNVSMHFGNLNIIHMSLWTRLSERQRNSTHLCYCFGRGLSARSKIKNR